MTFLSTTEKARLWQNDPRYLVYKELVDQAKTGEQVLWNPLLGEDFHVDEKQFSYAVVKEGKLYEMGETCKDIFAKSKFDKEIPSYKCIEHFITLHPCKYCVKFDPKLKDILKQLPETVLNSKEKYYYTIEPIHENSIHCSVGFNQQYHVAVTTIYLPYQR